MMGVSNAATAPTVSFTFCKSFAHAETKTVSWEQFARTVARSVGYDSKQESIKRAAIVGGVRPDETKGRADNIKTRTILTLDYDDFDGVSLEDIELALALEMDCAHVAYSTFRHTRDSPRVRIMAPLSREVGATEYAAIVDAMADKIGLGAPDPCSKTTNQLMFCASHRNGVEPWSAFGGDGALDVDALGLVVDASADQSDDGEIFDLDLAVASQPLDIDDGQVDTILENYPASDLDYDGWARVGMALSHQYEGKREGFDKWMAWSEKSPKHDPAQMRTKWRSFGGRTNPATMASIIKLAGGVKGGAVAIAPGSDTGVALEREAEAVSDMASYGAFKKRIQALSAVQLPADVRGMLASVVHEVFGKDAGMGLRDMKTAFKPLARARGVGDGDSAATIDAPEWLEGWVYDEANCLFVNSQVHSYAIKREAFRARFDRMPECGIHETDAATLALNMVQIPTVAAQMYWPGMDRMFEAGGKDILNSYFENGIAPSDSLENDADGEAVVRLFLDHVAMLIDDEREQGIFVDWLSHVYQRPGERVSWAMLLWGIEGNGKSYFFWLMRLLMGSNAKPITTSQIDGRFNDWAVGSVLSCIEEIRISGTNKWTILDQIKPMLTNDVVSVEPKGRASYDAPNFASYLMLTNHQDAIPMSNNDRRYCVIFTKHRTEADLFEDLGGREGVSAYFKRLFSESERRADAIGRWLLDRKQGSEFDAGGRAPTTRGIAHMREANVSEDENIVRDAIADHECEVVNDTIIDVTHLNNCVMADGDEMLPKNRTLSLILRDLGYMPAGPRYFRINGQKHYVWTKSRKMTDDDVKEIVRKFHANDGYFASVPF